MNYKMIGRFIARILSVEAAFMLPALIISAVGGEQNAVYGFLLTLALMIPVIALLFILCKKANGGPGVFMKVLLTIAGGGEWTAPPPLW